jgi:hypothetical protein
MKAKALLTIPVAVLCCSATEPDVQYQLGGEWAVTITPLQLPEAAKGAKGYTKTSCKPSLTKAAFPVVGREKELAPGVICRVVEVSPFDAPYRRVDQCRTASNPDARRIIYVGTHSPTRYSLTITTEVPGRKDLVVVVREDGERKGPCPAAGI